MTLILLCFNKKLEGQEGLSTPLKVPLTALDLCIPEATKIMFLEFKISLTPRVIARQPTGRFALDTV